MNEAESFEAETRFESDLRAAMASEPAGAELRRRILEQATSRSRKSTGAPADWLAAFDPRNWRLPVLVELGAVAAAASLAVGVFAGASGLVPSSLALDSTATTTVAANDSTYDTGSAVDLVALAYEGNGTGGLTGGSQ